MSLAMNRLAVHSRRCAPRVAYAVQAAALVAPDAPAVDGAGVPARRCAAVQALSGIEIVGAHRGDRVEAAAAVDLQRARRRAAERPALDVARYRASGPQFV